MSIKDIAEKVGVSKATVSIFLSDNETRRVGNQTKQKILKAIEDLDYRPNAVARALSSNRTNIIAILIPYNGPIFRSTYVDELLSGIQSVLYPRGYSMLFMPTQGQSSPDMVKHQMDIGLGYDGYILFGTRYCTLEDMSGNSKLLLRSGVPFSVVNMPEIDLDINQVIDVDPPETDAMDYLIRLGHKRISLVAGREAAPETRTALDGYRKSLISAELEIHEQDILYCDYERDLARSLMTKRIGSGVDFTAVYCYSDTMAAGVYEALGNNGFEIPGDVSVVGRNDSFFASIMDPPLTTVRRPIFESGVRASECVLRAIDGADDKRKIFLKSTLIQRMSTAPLLISNLSSIGDI